VDRRFLDLPAFHKSDRGAVWSKDHEDVCLRIEAIVQPVEPDEFRVEKIYASIQMHGMDVEQIKDGLVIFQAAGAGNVSRRQWKDVLLFSQCVHIVSFPYKNVPKVFGENLVDQLNLRDGD
jgi:hypothetical protein